MLSFVVSQWVSLRPVTTTTDSNNSHIFFSFKGSTVTVRDGNEVDHQIYILPPHKTVDVTYFFKLLLGDDNAGASALRKQEEGEGKS